MAGMERAGSNADTLDCVGSVRLHHEEPVRSEAAQGSIRGERGCHLSSIGSRFLAAFQSPNSNPRGYLTPEQGEALPASCDQLSRANDQFRQHFDAVTKGLARLQQVYAEERRKQETLLQTVERIQWANYFFRIPLLP